MTNIKTKQFLKALTMVNVENAFEDDGFYWEEVLININSIESIFPVAGTDEPKLNMYMTSGEKWTIKHTDELDGKLDQYLLR